MANSVDFRVKNGLLVASTATIQSSANATSTASGALQIVGGVGIGRDLYVGGTIYGNGIITTATNLAGGVLGQIPYQAAAGTTQFIGTGTVGSLLQMGANTATFVTTGSVYVGYANIASASSLVAITNDLTATAPNYLVAVSTSSGNQSLEVTAAWGPFVIPNTGVVIVNTVSNATSTGTGALVVKGGVGVGASLFIGGTATVVSGLASTTTLSANALYIAGGVGIAKSLLVTGEAIFQNNVTFSGTTTYVLSTNTIVTDNIINIHTPSGGVSGAWAVDDGKDIGLVFHNYKGVDNDSFLGWANDSGYLEWYGAGQETVGGTFTNAVYGIFKTGGIILTNTTASSSTGTGALTVAGGVGIGGNLYVGGTVFGTISGSITTATSIAGGILGQIPYQTSAGVTQFIGTGTAGTILQMGANTATFVTTGSIYVGFANQAVYANTATNVAGGVLGQIPYQSATGTTQYIGTGTAGTILQMGANTATFVTTGTVYIANAVTATNIRGGANGSIPYQTAAGATQFINTGTTGSLLQMGATTATFVSSSSVYVGYANTATTATSAAVAYSLANSASLTIGSATTATNIAGGIIGQIPYQTAAGLTQFIGTGTAGTILQMGANTASFVTTASVLVGSAQNIPGGTPGAIHYQSAIGVTQFINTGTLGSILQMGANTATFVSSSSVYVGYANTATTATSAAVAYSLANATSLTIGSATTATNIAGGIIGQIPYQSAAGLTQFIGTGTAGTILQMGANTATFVTTGSIYVGYANLAANATTATSAAVAYSLANTATIYAANANIANQINTVVQTANATYFATLVDSNNPTATGESVYTTSSFAINPSTGQVAIGSSFLSTSSKLTVNGRIESLTDPAAEGGQVTLRGKNFYRWSIDNYQDTFRIIKEDDVTESNGVTAVTITSGTNAVMIGASTQYSGEKLGVNGGVYVNGILTATSIFGTFNGTIGSASVNTATNLAGGTNGAIVYQVSSGATSFIGVGSAGSLLQMGASTATFVTTGSIYVGFANQAVYANTATNMAGGTNGALHYQVSPGVSSYIGTGTSGSLLQMGATTATFVTTGSIYVYRATQADSATGSSSQVNTVAQAANANYVLTFVDNNNATATGESVYTTSTVYVNPSTGRLTAVSVNVSQNGTGQGLLVGDDLWIGDINLSNTTQLSGAQDSTQAYLVFGSSNSTSLGRSGTGPLTYGGDFKVSGTTAASSTITGALQVIGGAGIGGNLYVGGTIFGTISGSITTATNIAGGVLGQIHYQTASGATGFIGTGTVGSILQMGANTATFVTTGSIYVGFANQAANATTATSAAVAYSLASTSSLYASFANQALYANTATNIAGGVLGQIPYQSAIGTTQYIGTGTTGSLLQMGANTATFVTTGTVYIANAVTATNIRGGANGSIPYQTAAGATQFINIGSAGTVLQSNGSTASFVAVGTLSAGTATSIAGGLLGQILYQTGAGTTGFIGTGTNGSILQMGANTATFVTTSSIYVGRAVIADNASTASQVTTVAQTTNATYFLTFVDANNLTPLVETIHTTSSFTINAASGGVRIGGVTTVTNTTNATSTVTGALQVAGGMGVGRDLWVGAGVYAATKSFLIDHPSKPGWKLVHGSLEGPENGVYVRGKITGSNKIHLPDFWINLVDFDSITVNLTPIGKYQQLFVENVQGLEITIANAQDSDMNFFYTVWAERVDVDKLRVEVN